MTHSVVWFVIGVTLKPKSPIDEFLFPFVEFDEDMGSEEESGKDWSELEEEAARGKNYLAESRQFSALD